MQTRTGSIGNCMEAAICSLLHLPLYALPDLGGDEVWLENLNWFLYPKNLFYLEVSPDDPMAEAAFRMGDTWHIIAGTSPRGGKHAVVGRNGRMVHDPHPPDGTGHGLVDIDKFGFLVSRLV